ncbi:MULTISPECIES: hypothetical protein [Bacteroides]|jgi:hypothetical protein|uniref:hypothetical protein n=1 Tax=Bacteroides TaxID=816 RepID=UPI00033D0E74|nr:MULTISPECIES: hypothetical protein [Bacteroides]MDO3390668.1 hypothetical protein [Bacteroides sp. ET489]CDB11043.1 putative uncharacterized protein [Bacteroides sp. CAG:633]
MKRFGLTLVAAFCLAATTFAAGNQPTTEKKWEGSINVNTLSKYLKLTQSQHEKVADICKYFKKQMTLANEVAEDQDEMRRKAVQANLKLMKETLDEKQYEEYAKVLNTTLENKGIEVK